jgi:hypothetical protein
MIKKIFFFLISLSKIVVGLMVFAIICTYTLQFYVPVAILWPSVQEKYGPFQSPALAEYLLRAVLVFATCNNLLCSLIYIIATTWRDNIIFVS